MTIPETPDLAQAAYLELAAWALERRDLPALIGALASLKTDTLDQHSAVTEHPAWALLAARLDLGEAQ
jgi:hypothetical protein